MSLKETLTESFEDIRIELNVDNEFRPDESWLSISKEKVLRECPLKYKLRYLDKLEGATKPRIATIGIGIHDSLEHIYRDGIQEHWYDMTPKSLAEHFYRIHRDFVEKHDSFTFWDVIYENNIRNLSEFEAQRFFSFLNGETPIPRDKMKYYFLPVMAEKFMKNAVLKYNYIPDGIFRLYETGDPEQDNNFLIFDLKAGSSQPATVKQDHKNQVISYSIFWNQVLDNPEKTLEAELHYHQQGLLATQYFEQMSQEDPDNKEEYLKKLDKYTWLASEIKKSNETIREFGGRIVDWGILYLSHGKLFYEKIQKRSLTAAHKRMEKARLLLHNSEWTSVWGSRTCSFEWVDKLTNELMEARCDYFDYCFEQDNQDLFEGL